METIQHKGGFPSRYYGYNGLFKPSQDPPKDSTFITTNQEDQTTRVYGEFEGNFEISVQNVQWLFQWLR
jgi:hypothetical protein